MNTDIELKLLRDWVNSYDAMYSQTLTKRLSFNLYGSWMIRIKKENESWKDSKLYTQGIQLFVAVETYNSLI